MENLWIIGYGLSGGFGGAEYFDVVEAEDQAEADMLAWEQACDMYESYVGNHGLRTVEEIMEEDGLEQDEAEETYNDEREDWLDYIAVPYTKEAEEEYSKYHYNNPFAEKLE